MKLNLLGQTSEIKFLGRHKRQLSQIIKWTCVISKEKEKKKKGNQASIRKLILFESEGDHGAFLFSFLEEGGGGGSSGQWVYCRVDWETSVDTVEVL